MQVKHYFSRRVVIKLEFEAESDQLGQIERIHTALADKMSEIYANTPERVRVKSYVNHQGINKATLSKGTRAWSLADVVLTSPNREERINIICNVTIHIPDSEGEESKEVENNDT